MIAKRDVLAALMSATGLATGLSALRAALSPNVTILAYHRVLDVPDEDAFPFDIELVSASVAQFAWQMKFLRRHFLPTTFGAILDSLSKGGSPPHGSVVVTFDDGFADNYQHAFPVLKALGIPATIFLSTQYVDDGSLVWYDRLAYVMLSSSEAELNHVGLLPEGFSGPLNAGLRREALTAALRDMKKLEDADRIHRLEQIFAAIPASNGWKEDGRSAPLTWDQVREMSSHGIEFGSHTVSHPVLSRVRGARLRDELVKSKHRIEEQIHRPARVLAYPVGGHEAFDEEVRREVVAAGYELAVSYIHGVERAESWDRLAVRRLHVERYVSDARFRCMMAMPTIFS